MSKTDPKTSRNASGLLAGYSRTPEKKNLALPFLKCRRYVF